MTKVVTIWPTLPRPCLIVILHALHAACCFFEASCSDEADGHSQPYDIETCTMGGPCERGIEGSPWDQRYGLNNYSALTRYLSALQFTAALITGGESPLQPGRGSERIMTIIMMFCSIFITSSVVGEVLIIIQRQSVENMAFDELMQQSREFMVVRKVPVPLQVRVFQYLESQHRALHKSQGSNRDFMGHLSEWLQAELIETINKAQICRHPFFKLIMPYTDVIRQICLDASPQIFAAGDTVVEEGHLAMDAHFIVRGKIRKDRAHMGTLYLTPPCWVSDRCLFVDTLQLSSIIAVISTEALVIRKTILQDVLQDEPGVLDIFESFQKQLLKDGGRSLKCPLCKEAGHCGNNCPNKHDIPERRGDGPNRDAKARREQAIKASSPEES